MGIQGLFLTDGKLMDIQGLEYPMQIALNIHFYDFFFETNTFQGKFNVLFFIIFDVECSLNYPFCPYIFPER